MSFPQDSVLIISWAKAFHVNWPQLEDFMFMFVLAKVGGWGNVSFFFPTLVKFIFFLILIYLF